MLDERSSHLVTHTLLDRDRLELRVVRVVDSSADVAGRELEQRDEVADELGTRHVGELLTVDDE